MPAIFESMDATLKGLALTGVDFGTFTSDTEFILCTQSPTVLASDGRGTPTCEPLWGEVCHQARRSVTVSPTARSLWLVGSHQLSSTIVVTAEDDYTRPRPTPLPSHRARAPSNGRDLESRLTLSGIDFGTFATGTESLQLQQVANRCGADARACPDTERLQIELCHKDWRSDLDSDATAYGQKSRCGQTGANVITIEVTAEDRRTIKDLQQLPSHGRNRVRPRTRL